MFIVKRGINELEENFFSQGIVTDDNNEERNALEKKNYKILKKVYKLNLFC
jgi:hypothetical protein